MSVCLPKRTLIKKKRMKGGYTVHNIMADDYYRQNKSLVTSFMSHPRVCFA